MPYEWLPWALDHLTGIEPDEVHQVLAGPHRLPLRAGPFTAILGRTTAGRPLAVLLRTLDWFDMQIIGARELTTDELIRYEKWEATR
jgi:hypothetical protein